MKTGAGIHLSHAPTLSPPLQGLVSNPPSLPSFPTQFPHLNPVLKYPRPMIPLKLTLQNFLCYRDDVPTLDLTGIRVACLCGGNGHGKSALLDAITWGPLGQGPG